MKKSGELLTLYLATCEVGNSGSVSPVAIATAASADEKRRESGQAGDFNSDNLLLVSVERFPDATD